jgi:hypothetical protein
LLKEEVSYGPQLNEKGWHSNPTVDKFPFGENGFKYDYDFDPKAP